MTFQFERTPHNQPRIIEGISVTKTGRIGPSKFFISTHNVQKGMRAYLYWDADRKVVAVEFTRNNDTEAYPIGFTRQYGAYINASKFFKIHHLDLDHYARRYSCSQTSGKEVGLSDVKTSIFIVDLKRPLSSRDGGAKAA